MAARFSWTHLATVVAGGALGTAARAGLLLIGDPAWQFVAVPLINVVGAFALGAVSALALRDAARLFWGVGVLSGFTTYSAMALLVTDTMPAWLGVLTALVGVLAAMLGMLLGRRLRSAT